MPPQNIQSLWPWPFPPYPPLLLVKPIRWSSSFLLCSTYWKSHMFLLTLPELSRAVNLTEKFSFICCRFGCAGVGNWMTEVGVHLSLVGWTRNWSRSGLWLPWTWIWNTGVISSGSDWLATINTFRQFPPAVQLASGLASINGIFCLIDWCSLHGLLNTTDI